MDIKEYLGHFKGTTSKHSEVSKTLTQLIERGILKPGEKLPTEDKMAKDLSVSKAITRKAYHDLMVQGLIQRLPKKGIVVSHAPTSHTFSSKLQSIGEDMVAMGLNPSIRLLSVVKSSNEVKKVSAFNPDESLLCVKRIILANDLPLMVMESCYSLDRYPKLESLDLNSNSIFEYLKSEYQENIVTIKRSLEPMMMAKDVSVLLGVSAETACTKAVSTTLNAQDECVEYGISYGIGDRFSISLQ